MSADRIFQRVWYERSPLLLFALLLPLSLPFAVLAAARRAAYRLGWLQSTRLSRPVIVVGNISVGGTGKTPLVIWITQFLQERGVEVGVVTRGYGGSASMWPQDVTANSPAELVGDEAALIAARTGAIVVAGPDRVAAAQRAITRGAQVIVSDDGLQHYRLQRDAEIVVVDAQRGIGNGWLLPAGPLRESRARLDAVDLVVQTVRAQAGAVSDDSTFPGAIVARHEISEVINLQSGKTRSIASFAGEFVHAVAAIGNPNAFFGMLRHHGLDVNARALADHQRLSAEDLAFSGDAPVLMTEKDAVKCRAFASERHWAVRLGVRLSESDERRLTALLTRIVGSTNANSNSEEWVKT